jgi:phenylacetate-CoA ligase
MYKSIAKHILAPLLDVYRGTKTMKCLQELEKTQWWPRDRILALQKERLRRLVSHAYDNVPYYHRIFEERGLKPEDIQTAEDLVKLPVLTKQLVRNNFRELMAKDFPQKEIVPHSTGGSTGEPLRFYRTKEDFYNWGSAAELRAYGWAGYEIGERCALLWEKYPYNSTIERFTRTFKEFLERIVVFNAQEMSSEKLRLFWKKMEKLQPEFIRGYPTTIYLLSQFAEREGNLNIRPKAIIAAGEKLHDYQRDLFGKVFECEAYSFYGTNEAHVIAAECPEHSGYHITTENIIVEVVEAKGEPVPIGEEGRILITNLHNYAMPFVRYEMGDLGALSDQACPCGRGLPLLATVTGRAADNIFTKSGRCVPGISLPFRIFASPGIEQFQIVQETYEKVVIKLVLNREYPEDRLNQSIKEILNQYRSILGEDMNISIEFVDQIPPTKSGKRRIVISNVPKPF